MSKAILGLSLVLILIVGSSIVLNAHSSSAIPVNNRVFYFTSSASLSLSPLPTSGPVSIGNLTKGPLVFALPQLQPKSSMTISGQITFILQVAWSGNTSKLPPVGLVGSLNYHYPTQAWTNRNSTLVEISPSPTPENVTIPLNVSEPPLLEQSTVTVQISALTYPRNANVSLVYGSAAYPSRVLLPLSGYETLYPPSVANPILVLDRFDNPTNYFPLNAAAGNNIVVVKLSVSSALGFEDISRVNMTTLSPSLQPVKGATNTTMQPSSPPNVSSPYDFIASWVYPSNATQGTYQIWISIIDSQNNVALTFRGPATFGLVPPGFVPFPYNLIPYFVVGSVGAASGVGGAVVYRKRRGKSYLVPFDHFNSLTGGALDGGTVVSVEGNTGSGKTILLEELMAEDLRSGKPCVFVSTGDFPNNIRASMKKMGIDVSGYEQNGLLTFVDGYSAEAGQESREKVSIPSLGDLTTIGIKLTSAFPSPSFKGGSLYFDSLTPLASKAKPETMVSFVQSVGAKVKGLSGKAFFTAGLGIDDTVQRQLEDNADCIIQMEAFEEGGSRRRRLKIAKFRGRKHQEGWTLFTIEEGKGIIFYSKRPKQ